MEIPSMPESKTCHTVTGLFSSCKTPPHFVLSKHRLPLCQAQQNRNAG